MAGEEKNGMCLNSKQRGGDHKIKEYTNDVDSGGHKEARRHSRIDIDPRKSHRNQGSHEGRDGHGADDSQGNRQRQRFHTVPKLSHRTDQKSINKSEDPLSTVALGAGKVIDSIEILKQVMIT